MVLAWSTIHAHRALPVSPRSKHRWRSCVGSSVNLRPTSPRPRHPRTCSRELQQRRRYTARRLARREGLQSRPRGAPLHLPVLCKQGVRGSSPLGSTLGSTSRQSTPSVPTYARFGNPLQTIMNTSDHATFFVAATREALEPVATSTLVSDPAPSSPRPRADRTRAHQLPSPGLTGEATGPRLPIPFTSPNTHAETGTPRPFQATVATTQTVTGTPIKCYNPQTLRSGVLLLQLFWSWRRRL